MVQVPTKSQVADLLTKNLAPKLFNKIRDWLLGTVPFDHSLYH